MEKKFSPAFFYLLSFIEGGAVMAAELIGAKMLAPYFGSSLYVWATVLAVTLGGLAIGYFCGGVLSYRKKGVQVLFYVMLVAAIFVVLMPFTAKTIMLIMGMYSLVPSVITSTVVFLLPPVLMMGMVSPLIIRSITENAEQSGKVAGAVYAISTVGGIITTFITGFYIIPVFGLTIPCIITGIILGIIPLAMLVKKNIFMSIFFILICGWSFYKAFSFDQRPGMDILYMSEGLLGQLMVIDYPSFDSNGKMNGTDRVLYVNRIAQSKRGYSDSVKSYSYVDVIVNNAVCDLPQGASVLVCGLGGGTLPDELVLKGCKVDACELDERVKQVADNYFGLSEKVNVIIDDARHYIRTRDKKYDLIILDLYRGEEIPSHCFTTEAFGDMIKRMHKDASIVINTAGFISGEAGKGMRSLYMTLNKSGFAVSLYRTEEREESGNLIFIAKSKYSFPHENKSVHDHCKTGKPLELSKADLSDAIVLHDDCPILDILNLKAYSTWRKNAIAYFRSEAKKGRSIPVFK